MQFRTIAPDYEISRVIRGNWQMAEGHGQSRSREAIDDLTAYADAGITTFDCADIYTGVEDLIGQFRRRYGLLRGQAASERIHVHTKFVPDLDLLPRIGKADVERVIDRSLKRLETDRLDLVQFHWWDYREPRWLETMHWLDEIRTSGKIRNLGATNFDSAHLGAILEAGIPLRSMQVQYSMLDRRPEKVMTAIAEASGVALLCYGTVAGGFLSDRWLGRPEPAGAFENRSLIKYKLIIDDIGGWDLFQALLRTLRRLGDRHGADIATVASAAMLSRPGVAAVIVGARDRTHLPANLAISDLSLTPEDLAEVEGVMAQASPLEGDVYTLERDREGRHGSIMKYNLNKGAA